MEFFFSYIANPPENGAVYFKWKKTFAGRRQQIIARSWFSEIGCCNKRKRTLDITAHFLGCQWKVEILLNPPTSVKEVTNNTQHLNSTQWRAAGGFTALARRCQTPLGTVLVWKTTYTTERSVLWKNIYKVTSHKEQWTFKTSYMLLDDNQWDFFSFMAYTRSYTLVLVKKARSLFQSTVLFVAQENTHAHARTHIKFVQADDCNRVKVHCPERSAALEKWCRAPHEPREKQKKQLNAVFSWSFTLRCWKVSLECWCSSSRRREAIKRT